MGQPCRLFKLAYSAAVDSHGCYPVGHAVGIEPVSKMCLPKTGMFQSMRGDFCRHTQRKKRVGHTETNTVLEKPAVCGLFATFSQVFEITALFGWRRSGDRAGLHRISLLTGNFTGNSAKLSLYRGLRAQEIVASRRFPETIPRELTGKAFRGTGKLRACIRDPRITLYSVLSIVDCSRFPKASTSQLQRVGGAVMIETDGLQYLKNRYSVGSSS